MAKKTARATSQYFDPARSLVASVERLKIIVVGRRSIQRQG